jgi:hypothetical protein
MVNDATIVEVDVLAFNGYPRMIMLVLSWDRR